MVTYIEVGRGGLYLYECQRELHPGAIINYSDFDVLSHACVDNVRRSVAYSVFVAT